MRRAWEAVLLVAAAWAEPCFGALSSPAEGVARRMEDRDRGRRVGSARTFGLTKSPRKLQKISNKDQLRETHRSRLAGC